MMKYKQVMSLALTVLLLMTACALVPTETTNTTTIEQTKPSRPESSYSDPTLPDPATADMNIYCQYLPKTVENPDNLPLLKWVCLTERTDGGTYGRIWNEAAAVELNQMLADRNMPFRVQFVIYTTDYPHTNMNWFVRPEIKELVAEADLLFGTISADDAKDYFMPLTEYAKGDAGPSLKNAVPHEINWLQSSVNGEVYGISQQLRYPISGGWVVDNQVLTEYGLTEQDFQIDFWEMDDLLEILSNKSGNSQVMFLSPSKKRLGTSYVTELVRRYPGIAADMLDTYFDEIVSIFALDDSLGVPTVVNMLDTNSSHLIRNAIIRYKAKYLEPTANKAKVYFKCSMTGSRTYTSMRDTNKRYIPIIDSTYYAVESMVFHCCSGVAVGTKFKNEAISMLNLIAEDEKFRMQLMFGKEGRDYTFDTDGYYCVTKQDDGTNYNMSFLSPWSYFCGMKVNNSQYPGTEDYIPQYEGMTVLESYLDMWDNVGKPHYPIRFDLSNLDEELNAVNAVCDQYFSNYASLTDEEYAEMIEKINAAGGTKIMVELQKQLDEWVKANPDKVAANRP